MVTSAYPGESERQNERGHKEETVQTAMPWADPSAKSRIHHPTVGHKFITVAIVMLLKAYLFLQVMCENIWCLHVCLLSVVQ